MSFTEAIRTALGKYVDFSGRASRKEFWSFAAFYFVTMYSLIIIQPAVGMLVWLGLALPYLAAAARRLHDMGRSGLWLLVALIPFGGLYVLFLLATQSEEGDNRFGPHPYHPGVAIPKAAPPVPSGSGWTT